MARDFKAKISSGLEDPFFNESKPGRKPIDHEEGVEEIVINLRKKYLSVPDILTVTDTMGLNRIFFGADSLNP